MFAQFFTKEYLIDFAFAIIRMSTPLIYCSVGAMFSKHAGAMNMALEGIMLTASLTAVIFSAMTQTVIFGILGAVLGGLLISVFLAFMVLNKNSELILTGVALNTFASGGTVYLLYMLTGEKGSSRLINSLAVPKWNIPLIKDIPVIGQIFSGHNALTYLAYVFAFVAWIIMFRTPLGLRIRAVGLNPDAASSVGVNVTKTKWIAFMLSGLFASIGGAFMSMGYLSLFSRDMIAGRGFIGMSATNLANGNVWGTVLASVFFGFADSASITLATLNLKAELVGMIPYLATVIGLVIISANKQVKAKRKMEGK